MEKKGITFNIPGHGELQIRHIVSDFTGTLSYRGRLAEGVWQRLHKLNEFIDIHVLSADTRGTSKEQVGNLPLQLHILAGDNHDAQKRDFAVKLDLRTVAAFGNGANDRSLLKAVKEAGGLAVAVDNGEGCAIEALSNAHILIFNAAHALDLLLDTDLVRATLRL